MIVFILSLFFATLGNCQNGNGNQQIIAGENANITSYPYQVSLMYLGGHICGGSIVSKEYIVTAAHCTYNFSSQINRLSVRAGSSFQGTGGRVVNVAQVIIHEQYSNRGVDYDISVLKLATPLEYSESIKPITLATSMPPAGTLGTVTGWGRIRETGPPSFQLQAVQLPILSTAQCQSIYRRVITPRMFCAGVINETIGSCFGDSGGPLAASGNLVGVVSFGLGCARRQFPTVYESIPNLNNWIRSKVTFDE